MMVLKLWSLRVLWRVSFDLTVLNKGRTLHLSTFAKYLNYPRDNNREFKRILHFLESMGFVEVQQGGFLGHSMCHEKIVAVKKPFELDKFRQVILGPIIL